MTPQEKLFKPEYFHELIHIAQGDLASAKGLFKIKAGRRENICFHAQQVIEKSIKAVLCKHSIAIPLVHDLGALIAKVPATLKIPFGYELSNLNDYAAIRRYEESVVEMTDSEIEEIIKVAEKIISWAKSI